jgi:hypothetical protein
LILVIIAPIIWLMSNKQTDKVGGTPWIQNYLYFHC